MRASSRTRVACSSPTAARLRGHAEIGGKLRDECLSVEWFRSRPEAIAVIETQTSHRRWRTDRMTRGYATPIDY
jgi:hypothetical protein